MNIKKMLLVLLGTTMGCFHLHAEIPLLMKLYGDRYVGGITQHPSRVAAGTLDVSLGTDGGRDLSGTFVAGVVPQVVRVLSNGFILIAADDSANNQIKVAKFDCDGFLDSSFATSGIRLVAKEDVKDLFVDAQGRIILVGGKSNSSWIARLTATGDLDNNFGTSGITSGDAYDFKAVGEQQSGRLIAVGKNANGGVIYGYRSDGIADQSFNTIPGLGSRGFYETGSSSGVYDVAIDPSDDTINIVYKDALDKVAVRKLTADGSLLVASFGLSGSIALTDRIPNVTDETQVRLAIDSVGKIVVAAVNSSNQFVVRRYTSAGAVDSSFNGDGSVLTIAGVTAPKITHLVTTEEDQIIVMGYDDTTDDRMFVARIKSDGTLDTAFSATGLISYELNAANTDRQLRFGAIHPDGRLMLVGYEQDGGSDKAVLVRQYGDSYVPEYEQAPRSATIGTLDTTFDADGILDLATIDTSLAGSIAKHVTVFDDSSMLIFTQKASDSTTKVVRLNPILGLESTFNGGSVLSIASASTVEGFAVDKKYDTTGSYVDTAQGFFVGGTHSAAPWVKHYDSTGTVDANFTFAVPTNMAACHALAQQSSGRLLVAGNDGTDAIISAHKIDGSIDTIFGSNGVHTLPSGSTDLYAMVVDSQDRIYVAYNNAGTVEVKRICPNGDHIDTTFTASANLSAVMTDESNIAIALDENEDVIVAGLGNVLYARRYSAVDGSVDATFNAASGEFVQGIVGASKLTDLQVQSTGKILMTVYNTSNNRAYVFRLLASGAYDTSFNPDGIVPGALIIDDTTDDYAAHSIDMHPDRRGIVVGHDSTANTPLMYRVIGDDDDYVELVEQTPVAGVEGEFDLSLASDGSLDLSSLTNIGADQAHTVRVTNDGRILVGLRTAASATKIAKLSCDAELESSFGSSGIATLSTVGNIVDMYVDVDQKILSLGTSGGESWLHRHTVAGASDTTFGGAGFATTNVTAGYTVREQKSGRLIMGGLDGSSGTLVGYTTKGALDLSFGSGTGKLAIGTTGIYAVAIDASDNILVAYDNGSNQVVLARYRPNGFGLDTTFNAGGTTPGQVDDALATTINAADQIRIALDEDGKILVACVDAAGIKIARYDATGALDATFGSSGYATLANTVFKMTDFIVGKDNILSADGKMAVVGYNDEADDSMFVAWFNHDGSAATEFNPTGQVGGAPGTISFVLDEAANATRQIRAAAMLQDGRWLFVGYENNTADVPLLMRVHGQRYAEEHPPTPAEGLDGEFDPVWNANGKLSFNYGAIATLNQYGQAIASLDDGNFIVAGYGQTDDFPSNQRFLLTKYTSDGKLVTSFGSTGGTTEIAGRSITVPMDDAIDEYLYDIAIDHLGRIVSVGYQDTGTGKTLVRRHTAAGEIDTSFGGLAVDVEETVIDPAGTVSTDATDAFAVAIQSTGRIIVVGEDNSSLNRGVLLAYDIDGRLDSTFGINGIWYIDDASAVYSMAIDKDDSIFVSYKHSTTNKAVVAKLPYNGNQFDFSFGASGTGKIEDALGVDVLDTQSVKVGVDGSGNVVVAASHASNNTVLINKFTEAGAVDPGFNGGSALVVAPAGGASDNLVLTKLLTTEAGGYVLVGYQDVDGSTDDNFWAARVTTAGVLDTDFNASGATPGQQSFKINGSGSLQKFANATVSSEGKIFMVGQESVSGVVQPVVASLYNYRYEDEVRAPAFISDGGYDTSFNETGIVYPYVGGASSTLNQAALGVRELPSGKSIAVIGDGINSWLVRYNLDGTIDTSFGTSPGSGAQLLPRKVAENETIYGIELDGCGRTLVFGSSTTNGAFIKRFNTNGSVDTAFGGGADPSGTRYNVMTEIHSIAEMNDGKLIVSGINGGVGSIKKYSSAGTVDGSFSFSNGLNIPSVTVDDDNNIYAVAGYLDTVKKVRLIGLNSIGSGLSTFGTSGVVDDVLTDIARYEDIKIAKTYEDQLVVGASWNDGTEDQVAVVRYDIEGVIHDTFNSGVKLDLNFASEAGVTRHLKDIMVLNNGKVLLVGFQDGGDVVTDNDRMFVARVKSSGLLDETFNADAVSDGTGNAAGMYLFKVNSSLQHTRRLYGLDVQIDGRILLAGAESPANGEDTPVLMRINGDDYVKHVDRFPGYGKAGTFDVSFGLKKDGIEKIYFGNEIDLTQSGVGIAALSTGKIALLGNGFTDTDRAKQHYLFARLNKDGTLDQNIVGQNGAINGVKIGSNVGSNSEFLLDAVVDRNGKILTAGYVDDTTDQGVLRRYHQDNTGRLDGFFKGNGSLNGTIVDSVVEQYQAITFQGTDGRIVAAGNQGGQGVIVVLKEDTGKPDTEFGTDGKYLFADTTEIKSVVVVGQSDTIYVARIVAGDLVVSALASDGSGLISDFGTAGTQTVFASVTDVGRSWLAVDSNEKLVVAATVDDGGNSRVKVKRLNIDGSADTNFNGDGSELVLFTGDQSDRVNVVTRVVPMTDGKTIIIGYQDITGVPEDYMYALRINSSGTGLDSSFDAAGSTPGIVSFRVYQTGDYSKLNNVSIDSLGRLVLVGNEAPDFGGNSPVVIRMHGDYGVGAVQQYPGWRPADINLGTQASAGGGSTALSGSATSSPPNSNAGSGWGGNSGWGASSNSGWGGGNSGWGRKSGPHSSKVNNK